MRKSVSRGRARAESGEMAMSATLEMNERIKRRMQGGEDIIHMAFGEAGLPVHPLLVEALTAAGAFNSYGPVAGDQDLRSSISDYLTRRGVASDPTVVMVTPGCKAALFALLLALPGDVILPQPSWVSYEPQAALAKKQVIRVPIPPECGGVPGPAAFRETMKEARDAGHDPRILILTTPDNPTGTIASKRLLEETCEIARSEGIMVIADEIYRDLAYNEDEFVSAAMCDSENVVIVSGLSKNLALGGWRIGFIRTPNSAAGRKLIGTLCAIGSEIWSCVPPPIAAAAQVAFSEPPEIHRHVALSRELHRKTTETVFRAVVDSGVRCRRPQAAFYLYPDLEAQRSTLATRGILTSQDLADELLDTWNIAVLPGCVFGEHANTLTFRLATSLLHGRGDSGQWQALSTGTIGDSRAMKRIAAASDELEHALRVLAAGA
jgi:aspartate aminotransferase